MKISFAAPRLTALTSLETLARNVDSVVLEPAPALPERTVEVERAAGRIHWHEGTRRLIFSVDDVARLQKTPRRHGDEDFVAIAVTFKNHGDATTYYLVTSHVSEEGWLDRTLQDVSEVLGTAVST